MKLTRSISKLAVASAIVLSCSCVYAAGPSSADSAPSAAYVQSPIYAALTGLFGAFENRQDDLQNNQDLRNQALEKRRVMLEASTTLSGQMTFSQFEDRKSSVVAELQDSMQNLSDNRDQIAAFIASSTGNGYDMDAASAALDTADDSINTAGQTLDTLIAYDPTVDPSAPSNALVDTSVAQSDLQAAISAIAAARNSLDIALRLAAATFKPNLTQPTPIPAPFATAKSNSFLQWIHLPISL